MLERLVQWLTRCPETYDGFRYRCEHRRWHSGYHFAMRRFQDGSVGTRQWR